MLLLLILLASAASAELWHSTVTMRPIKPCVDDSCFHDVRRVMDCTQYLVKTISRTGPTTTITKTETGSLTITKTAAETWTLTRPANMTSTVTVSETGGQTSTAVVTVTTAARANSNNNNNNKRALAKRAAFPSYAFRPCGTYKNYSSACSCLGVTRSKTTIVSPTATATATTTVDATVTVTPIIVVTVTATVTPTVTSTVTVIPTSSTVIPPIVLTITISPSSASSTTSTSPTSSTSPESSTTTTSSTSSTGISIVVSTVTVTASSSSSALPASSTGIVLRANRSGHNLNTLAVLVGRNDAKLYGVEFQSDVTTAQRFDVESGSGLVRAASGDANGLFGTYCFVDPFSEILFGNKSVMDADRFGNVTCTVETDRDDNFACLYNGDKSEFWICGKELYITEQDYPFGQSCSEGNEAQKITLTALFDK